MSTPEMRVSAEAIHSDTSAPLNKDRSNDGSQTFLTSAIAGVWDISSAELSIVLVHVGGQGLEETEYIQ